MAVSSDQQMRPIFADKEHYFKALTHFTSKSDNLKVLQGWVDGDFVPEILDKLELLLKSPEDELQILSVGSGAGKLLLLLLFWIIVYKITHEDFHILGLTRFCSQCDLWEKTFKSFSAFVFNSVCSESMIATKSDIASFLYRLKIKEIQPIIASFAS